MLTNRGETTENICPKESIWWTNIDNQNMINEDTVQALKTNKKNRKRRASIYSGFELNESLRKWEILINRCLKKETSQN